MKINELPTASTVDNTYYIPLDVSGDTKILNAGDVLPVIANNLTTTTAGSILDASQGKALDDAITANTTAINAITSTANAVTFYKAQRWQLNGERDVNNVYLYYPPSANEVLIVAYENTDKIIFSAIFVPAMITADTYLFLGGYWEGEGVNSSRVGSFRVKLIYNGYKVSNISGAYKVSSGTSVFTDVTTSSDWSTKVYYR